MRSIGATSKDQYQPARADVGVRAADAWLDMAGYDSMWQQRLGLANSPAAAASAAGGADHAATASNSSSSSSHVGQEDVPAPSGTNSAAEASPSSSSGSSGGTASSSGNARDRGARGPWAGRGYQAPSDEDIFNVWTRHTQHCAVCLQVRRVRQGSGFRVNCCVSTGCNECMVSQQLAAPQSHNAAAWMHVAVSLPCLPACPLSATTTTGVEDAAAVWEHSVVGCCAAGCRGRGADSGCQDLPQPWQHPGSSCSRRLLVGSAEGAVVQA